jgi:photosystem II stability/assembly factor-like uncharacterized protein
MTASGSVLYAGTVGQGVWRSLDRGETFHRYCAGMFMEAEVRALAVHPSDPGTLLAGTDAGLYRTSNGGERWTRLETPFDPGSGWPSGVAVWSLLVHPKNPDLIYAGTCPSAIYRSRDGGAHWEKLGAALTPECPPIVYSRVTCLRADPNVDNRIWAGVEIDGAWRSDDAGDTWVRLTEGLSSMDIHDLAVLPGRSRTVLATTNNDLNISRDNGETWQPQQVRELFPFAYCRGLTLKSDDPLTLFLGNGNGPPGTAGAVQVSRDGGQSWRQAALPVAPNSTIWTFAANARVPALLYCASINGYIYRSDDCASTWHKCAHEFGEVRCLALIVSGE